MPSNALFARSNFTFAAWQIARSTRSQPLTVVALITVVTSTATSSADLRGFVSARRWRTIVFPVVIHVATLVLSQRSMW